MNRLLSLKCADSNTSNASMGGYETALDDSNCSGMSLYYSMSNGDSSVMMDETLREPDDQHNITTINVGEMIATPIATEAATVTNTPPQFANENEQNQAQSLFSIPSIVITSPLPAHINMETNSVDPPSLNHVKTPISIPSIVITTPPEADDINMETNSDQQSAGMIIRKVRIAASSTSSAEMNAENIPPLPVDKRVSLSVKFRQTRKSTMTMSRLKNGLATISEVPTKRSPPLATAVNVASTAANKTTTKVTLKNRKSLAPPKARSPGAGIRTTTTRRLSSRPVQNAVPIPTTTTRRQSSIRTNNVPMPNPPNEAGPSSTTETTANVMPKRRTRQSVSGSSNRPPPTASPKRPIVKSPIKPLKVTLKAPAENVFQKPASYKCNTCKKTFLQLSNWTKHKQTHDQAVVQNATEFQCKHCDRKFSIAGALETHLQINCTKISAADRRKILSLADSASHRIAVPSAAVSPRSSSSELSGCSSDESGATSAKRSNRRKTVSKVPFSGIHRTPSKVIKCTKCREEFPNYIMLMTHQASAHT